MNPSTIQAFVEHEQRLAEHLESKISLDASDTGFEFMCDAVQASVPPARDDKPTFVSEIRSDPCCTPLDSLMDMYADDMVPTNAETEPIPLECEQTRGQLTLSSLVLHDQPGSLSAWAMDWVGSTDGSGE
jgi:hypothetical protein